jgi:cytosine/adenosine deaminase-related metal-dependent hydrolase
VHDDVFVAFAGPVLTEVRPARPGDPARTAGVLVPGLINAHTHLELSWSERVPGGDGFVPWAGRLMAQTRPDDATRLRAARDAARALVDGGVAGVSDICGEGSTAELLIEAELVGVAQVELLGFDRERAAANSARAGELPRRHGGGVTTRAAAHAIFSTAPDLIQAALRPPGPGWPPGSVHLGEDAAEVEFLVRGTGPYAELLDRLDVAWRWWRPVSASPVEYLDRLGVLGPDTLIVHAVHTSADDREALGRTRTPVCLCPRSNLHIGAHLPEVEQLLEGGIRLCLGTDSLASSPDLDVLGEIPVLCAAFPQVPVEVWLSLATAGGASALRLAGYGRLVEGTAPGALLLDGDLAGLRRAAPERRWWVRPGPAPQGEA